MLLQIFMISSDIINNITLVPIMRFILLMASWLLTIFVSVPLHKRIERNNDLEGSIEKLIQTNMPRTLTWTAIYLSNFL